MTEFSKKVITFGCRLNNLESELISQQLKNHSIDTNTFIFNTCAVTSEAERKARQSIRKIKKENPNAKIVVTGCSAQIDPKKWLQMEEVSNVIGNSEKTKKEFWKNFSLNQQNLSPRKNDIILDGGKLIINWLESDDIIMSGEVNLVFKGDFYCE